jgi:hypothetical protein
MPIDLSRIQSTLDALQKNNSREKVDFKKVLWSPVKGKEYKVRMLPSKYDPTFPFFVIKFHDGLGVKYSVRVLPENDPILIAAAELRKSADPVSVQIGKDLKVKQSIFVPVIVRGEEELGVRLYKFSKTLYASLLADAADTENNGDIFDPKTGSDFKVTTIEKPLGDGKSTYLEATWKIMRNSSELSKDPAKITEWLENQPNPDELYEYKTADELKELLFAMVNRKGQDEPDTASSVPAQMQVPAPTQPAESEADIFAKLFE